MTEQPAPKRKRFGVRTALAAAGVISLAAVATATAGILEVQSFVDDLNSGQKLKVGPGVLSTADVGRPQTILLLGSDRRFKAGRKDARSDTIMLVRLDADASGTAVMNIPRDLKAAIPLPGGRVVTEKINATYSLGGPALTAKVVKDLLGIPINHVINVNFGGFRKAVDYIDCVYADIDRRYFNDNSGAAYGQGYAVIDIQAGYQKLCGTKALDYVRFRHLDTDIVRSARQQDFVRQARQQYGVQQAVGNRHELAKIFSTYAQSDSSLHSVDALLKLLNLLAFSSGKPVVSIPFPAILSNDPRNGYIGVNQLELQKAVKRFLGQRPAPVKRNGSGAKPKKQRSSGAVAKANVVVNLDGARQQAEALRGLGIPIMAPKVIPVGSRYMGPEPPKYPRAYVMRDTEGKRQAAYRIVGTTNGIGQFWGIQGTSWKNPPLLDGPTATKTLKGGRKLLLFGDGKRLRFVGFKTSKGSYWVSNTLSEDLDNRTMVAMAASLVPLAR